MREIEILQIFVFQIVYTQLIKQTRYFLKFACGLVTGKIRPKRSPFKNAPKARSALQGIPLENFHLAVYKEEILFSNLFISPKTDENVFLVKEKGSQKD